jgi:hypothetical protein
MKWYKGEIDDAITEGVKSKVVASSNPSNNNNNNNNKNKKKPKVNTSFNVGLEKYGTNDMRDGSSSVLTALLRENTKMVDDNGNKRLWDFGNETYSFGDMLVELEKFGELGIDKYGKTQLMINDDITVNIRTEVGESGEDKVIQLKPVTMKKGQLITLKGDEVVEFYKSLHEAEYIKNN